MTKKTLLLILYVLCIQPSVVFGQDDHDHRDFSHLSDSTFQPFDNTAVLKYNVSMDLEMSVTVQNRYENLWEKKMDETECTNWESVVQKH